MDNESILFHIVLKFRRLIPFIWKLFSPQNLSQDVSTIFSICCVQNCIFNRIITTKIYITKDTTAPVLNIFVTLLQFVSHKSVTLNQTTLVNGHSYALSRTVPSTASLLTISARTAELSHQQDCLSKGLKIPSGRCSWRRNVNKVAGLIRSAS